MFIIKEKLHFFKTEIFSIKFVKKTYQIISNDYNFFRPQKLNKIFQTSFTMSMDTENDSPKLMIQPHL